MSLAEAMQGQISGLDFSDTSVNDRSLSAAFVRDQQFRFQSGDARRINPLSEPIKDGSGSSQATT